MDRKKTLAIAGDSQVSGFGSQTTGSMQEHRKRTLLRQYNKNVLFSIVRLRSDPATRSLCSESHIPRRSAGSEGFAEYLTFPVVRTKVVSQRSQARALFVCAVVG
jgi:hypothetical protein